MLRERAAAGLAAASITAPIAFAHGDRSVFSCENVTFVTGAVAPCPAV